MQNRFKALIGLPLTILTCYLAITTRIPTPPTATPCTDGWFTYIEEHYFSTERGDIWSDPVSLDWTVDGDWRWFDFVEKKAGALPSSVGVSKEQRCELLQSRLKSRVYIINDSIGLFISFSRRR